APRIVGDHPQYWTPAVGDISNLLEAMQKIARRGPVADHIQSKGQTQSDDVLPDPDLPFIGGWLGWLGYDFAWEIERLPWRKDDALPFPVAFWYEPATFAVLDHFKQRLWLAAETAEVLDDMSSQVALKDQPNATPSDATPRSDDFPSIYIEGKNGERDASSSCKPSELQPVDPATENWVTHSLCFETEQAEFEQAVQQAKAHIRAGDVFQVNHSLRFQAQTTMPSWAVYKTLHRINPSPFASYWHTPWGAVVSCSPERLVQLQNGVAQSRPIAGTRPRGKTLAADDAIAQELAGDAKECAEHIMLVDLERNDLGRVCDWGSVQVNELMTIERYSHVMHLVSNVIGQLPPETSAAQLVSALFPGGTITGCPKVRCMEIIEALEPVRRSLFYGSCGYFDRRGRLDLNILIRTLLMASPEQTASSEQSETQTVWGQVGAGIVADSEPRREWFESLQKAKAQLLALGL
ncbi:MAG: chorismate-binding protein, partial [Cyanobacteria bacterium J06598_3]